MRVQDLAKKYKIGKKEFLEVLEYNVGIKGKKTISALSRDEIKKIEKYIEDKVKEKISAQEEKERTVEVKKEGKEKAAQSEEKPEKDKTGKRKVERKKAVKKAEKKQVAAKKKTKEKPMKGVGKTAREKTEKKETVVKPSPEVHKKPPSKKKQVVAEEKKKEPGKETAKKPPVVKKPAPRAHKKPPEKEKQVVAKEEKKDVVEPEVQVKNKVVLEGTENIKQLSEKINVSSADIIKYFFSIGFMVTVNQSPGKENIRKVCESFGLTAEFKKPETVFKEKPGEERKEKILIPRAPVVTIMGHVDHGKTTMLDTIRKSRIAEKEHGLITQKIGAYKLKVGDKGEIVFLDTPGHEAFTAMRGRGTLITDIVILVVAADEGVKPQTVEAINHARSANVPIIVAISKIDKPNLNLDKVKKQLTEYKLVPEEWGGDTIFVNVSGLTGAGINELLEMLILMGEMLELKADPEGRAEGVVIESFIDRAKGPIINALIRRGTLKTGDPFIVGEIRGKVRAIMDDWNKHLNTAGPSTPVEILGASGVAIPGEKFQVVGSEKEARQIFEEKVAGHLQKGTGIKKVTLQEVYDEIQKGEIKELKLIIKTDYVGTIDAIKNVIGKIPDSEVKISIIHSETGAISESDVLLASASNAVIVGFNVPLTQQVEEIANAEGVEVRIYKVIYELAEDITKAVEGMLEPDEQDVLSGQAVVRKVFHLSDKSTIAGCLVVNGRIIRNSTSKVIRGGSVIFQGTISNLKRFKEAVREVKENTECGIEIGNFTEFQDGDIIQSYVKTKTAKKL
jgi:translation initiation factor IF-2